MTAGNCLKCGEYKKNLEAHARFCKGTLQEIKQELPQKTTNKRKLFFGGLAFVSFIIGLIVVTNRSRLLFAVAFFIASLFFAIFAMLQKPKQQPKVKRVVPIEEILNNLPDWSIKEAKPMFMPKDKKQRLIQFAGFSRVKRPVFAWVLWDGVYISIGNIAGEERLYKPPHDIRGEVFPYDLDYMHPLLDNVNLNDKDSFQSLKAGQIRNLSFTLGVLSGAKNLLNQLGTVQLLLIIIGILELANIIITYSATKDVNAFVSRVSPMIDNATAYFASHP